VDKPTPTPTPSEPASPGPEPTPSEAREASPKAERKRIRPMGVALRVAAILVILGAMFALGHVLRSPGGWGGNVAGDGSAAWPPEVDDADNRAPPPDPRPTTEAEARDGLRQMMAGLLMAAAGDDDATDDEAPADPTAAQRRVADWFGFPYNYPAGAAPAGVVPPGVEVLMVVGNPERQESRMVLARVRKGVDEALESFYRHYRSMGWEADTLKSPARHRDAQPDRGWLVRFAKGRRERLVYARPRAGADETLVAVYDPNYEGE